ncbi:MAG: hypothetical protein ACOX87_11000 [Chloroflexota bacterium]|jgi:hypothetical protein
MRRTLLSLLMVAVAVLAINGSAIAQTPPPVIIPADDPPGTFIPVVLATDEFSAIQGGDWISDFVDQMDNQFLQQWAFRPSLPTTIYLFGSGDALANGFAMITDQALTVPELELIANVDRSYFVLDQRTGGYAVLVNLLPDFGTQAWMEEVRAAIYHGYALAMERDRAGEAGPSWYREGLAWFIAYTNAPGAPSLSRRVQAAATLNAQGTLPSLSDLSDEDNFSSFTSASPQTRDAAFGFAYLAINLMSPVGGLTLLNVLVDAQGPQNFEEALLDRTGFTVEQLSTQTKLRMPAPGAVAVLTPEPLVAGATPLPVGVPALVPSLQQPQGPVQEENNSLP